MGPSAGTEDLQLQLPMSAGGLKHKPGPGAGPGEGATPGAASGAAVLPGAATTAAATASRSLVVPATQTPEHWLNLSNLDRVVNPTFSSAILFYNNLLARNNDHHEEGDSDGTAEKDDDDDDGGNPKPTFPEIVETLKESLAKVLVDFYPLAGRLALREEGLVDLHCNDQGAIFLEVTLDAELSSTSTIGAKDGGDDGGRAAAAGPLWEGLVMQPMPHLSGLELAKLGPGPQYIPDQLTPMPTLVVQVTRFAKCGSVALAVNWHHTVADGSSGCHFMQSWAEVAMGKPVSLKPDHNREVLSPRTPLDSSLVQSYGKRSEQLELKLSISGAADREVEDDDNDDDNNQEGRNADDDNCEAPKGSSGSSGISPEPAVLRSFPVSRRTVQELKAKAKAMALGGKRQQQEDSEEFTSAEAISGFLWQLMTKARMEGDGSENCSEHEQLVNGNGEAMKHCCVDGGRDCDNGGSLVTRERKGMWRRENYDRAEDGKRRGVREREIGGRKNRRRTRQVTKFYMFLDGRRRLELRREYFGNVIFSACALSTEQEIVEKPFSHSADLIRSSTRTVTGEHFRSLIDWVEEQKRERRHRKPCKAPEHLNSFGHDVAATFWTYFPLYDIDFGWGQPSFATRNAGPRPLIDGIAMMPSPAGPGEMIALLNLHADRMRRLQRDPTFSTLFCSG